MPAGRLGRVGRGDEVRVGDPRHLDGIGLIRLQGIQHAVSLGTGNLVAVQGVLVHADALVAFLVGHLVPALGDEGARVRVVLRLSGRGVTGDVLGHRQVGDDVAAGNVQVAAHAYHGEYALAGLHAVGVLVEGEAPGDGGRVGVGVHAGHRVDVLDGNLADASGVLGRHVGDALGELVKAVGPALHEIVVVEVFLDDDVAHRHGKGGIRAVAQT